MNAINPTVDGQLLTAIPCVLNNSRLANIGNRFDNVQLTQAIVFHPWRQGIAKVFFMFLMNVLNMTQPVVSQTDTLTASWQREHPNNHNGLSP